MTNLIEFKGKSYKKIPVTNRFKDDCTQCALERGNCIQDQIGYCELGHCYEELDPLYADLLKVKEACNGKKNQDIHR